MEYIEVKIKVDKELSDILIAELDSLGYDSFAEHDHGIDAYITKDLFSEGETLEVLKRYGCDKGLEIGNLENKNWNEEWEKNFSPVEIGTDCVVKAPFHNVTKQYSYEIILNPRMAFGTGHHETTSMMIKHQLSIDHTDKKILDAGSGTGILAIMACLRGATDVTAFDIDEWAFDNIFENISLNGCNDNIRVFKGDVNLEELYDRKYDIILANINLNILLQDMSSYKKLLSDEGLLIMSGFLTSDKEAIGNAAKDLGLEQTAELSNNNWVSIVYKNKNTDHA